MTAKSAFADSFGCRYSFAAPFAALRVFELRVYELMVYELSVNHVVSTFLFAAFRALAHPLCINSAEQGITCYYITSLVQSK